MARVLYFLKEGIIVLEFMYYIRERYFKEEYIAFLSTEIWGGCN